MKIDEIIFLFGKKIISLRCNSVHGEVGEWLKPPVC